MSRWDLLEELYDLALPLDDAARDELLAARCTDDPSLRAELLEMLATTGPDHALAIERLVCAAPTRPAHDDAAIDAMSDRVIGRWRIVSLLGRGGMASVYRAERADGEYRQQAALKLVSVGATSDELLERFRTERQVLAQLSHPHIARLLDGGIADDGRPYLVMELVDGEPITTWCKAHDLDVADRLRLFRVVCEAVQHAHGNLVVHRDLKPANTFVTVTGEVKLLDFGIAKMLAPDAFGVDAGATRDQLAPLTPEYAAPEQMFGGTITTATDVYSLGVLLYELLTGRRPYALDGKSPIESERVIAADAIVPPSKHLGLSRGDDLDSIVLTALRAQPERRYTSAGQLGEDIARYLDRRPVIARADTVVYRARRFVARNRAGVVVAMAFTFAVVGFGLFALSQARHAAAERDLAELERDKSDKVVALLATLFETTNPTKRPGGDKLPLGEFLDTAEPLVLDQLASEPAVQARLRQVFGSIHAARDDFKTARALLEQAAADQERLLGAYHPDTIESYYQLGMLRAHIGDIEGSTSTLRDVLARDLAVYGVSDNHTALTLVALTRDDRPAESKQLLDQALAIQRHVLPPRHRDLAATLGALGQYYLLIEDHDLARRHYAEALAMFQTPEERNTPTVLQLLQGLAVAQERLGDVPGARKSVGEAVVIADSIYGHNSLAAAQATHNLAVMLASDHAPSDGEPVFREAYERHRKALGDEHWATVNAERDLALIVSLQGRYREALAIFDHAIASCRRLPKSHEGMLHHMQGKRAIVLQRLGRGEEAVAEVTAALVEATAPTANDNPYIVVSLNVAMAAVLIEMARAPEATPFARKAVATAEDKTTRALAQCLLGSALLREGKLSEGSTAMSAGLPTYRKSRTADPQLLALFDSLVAAN